MTEQVKKNLYQKICHIMQEVSYVEKTKKGNGLSYDYVSHDAVTIMLHDVIADAGIVILPSVVSHRIEFYETQTIDKDKNLKVIQGNKSYLEIDITMINADNPEERITSKAFGYALDNQDKGYGKAFSYAMKYFYCKTFLLQSGEKDDVESDQDNDIKKVIYHKPDVKKVEFTLNKNDVKKEKPVEPSTDEDWYDVGEPPEEMSDQDQVDPSMSSDYVFNFGKHAGKTIDEVGKNYVVWMKENLKDLLTNPKYKNLVVALKLRGDL